MNSASAIRTPLQSRSRRTLDRLLEATEALLEDRSFESITVADIARRARCSTGAIYGRVAGKEDLLPLLYERYDADLQERIERTLSDEDWAGLELAGIIERLVRLTVEAYRSRRYLLEAMALFSRRRPEAITADVRERRGAMHRRLAQALLSCRHELAHPYPEHAAQFALYMIAAVCRDKLIFGSSPHAQSLEAADERLINELTRAVLGYLAMPQPPTRSPNATNSGKDT